MRRILAAKGFVEFGRVNGNLALSRAVGDFELKKNRNLAAEDQIVTGKRCWNYFRALGLTTIPHSLFLPGLLFCFFARLVP